MCLKHFLKKHDTILFILDRLEGRFDRLEGNVDGLRGDVTKENPCR